MLTIEQVVRQEFRQERGEEDTQSRQHKKMGDGVCTPSCPACAVFTLAQKYGLVKPILDKKINNPGWVEGEVWSKQKEQWNTLVNSVVKRNRR